MKAYPIEKKQQITTSFVSMMDFAVRVKRCKAGDFIKQFISSSVAGKLGVGDALVSGLTGVELYEMVTGEKCFEEHVLPSNSSFNAIMQLVACYQYESGRSFKEIFFSYPVDQMVLCDEQAFFAEVEARIKRRPTNLEYFRSQAGLSQSELAYLSGVDIRSIQMYEQRRNDISKAQYNILNALCRVLTCSVNDLMDENNYRLAKGEIDLDPVNTFTSLCLFEAKRREFACAYDNVFKAQAEARKFFYVYGYLAVFPAKKLTFEKGNYTVEKEDFVSSWCAYFDKMISSKKLKESVRTTAKESVAALCPANKKLTSEILVQAVLSAVELIEAL